MKLNKIKSDTNINPLGQEIRLGFANKNQNKAVLLLHGFGGRSSNWNYAAQKIYQKMKIPIYVPRLPGHATNTEDFLNSNADQWLRKAVDSYLYLASSYPQIYLAGFSMGGLLAAILAAKFKPEKLSLVAPAFFTVNQNIVFAPYLKYFIKKIDNDFKLEKENLNKLEIDFHQNYSCYYYPQALAELYKLMQQGRKSITKIKTPTQLILSKTDEQVATPKINDFLNKKMGRFLVDQKTYQKSSHVIINDLKKEACTQAIINFFFD